MQKITIIFKTLITGSNLKKKNKKKTNSPKPSSENEDRTRLGPKLEPD